MSLHSINNGQIINSINECDPIQPLKYRRTKNPAGLYNRSREPRVVYTMINTRNLSSRVRNFFCYWNFLRAKNSSLLVHFITSRIYQVHQKHVNVFIRLYTPNVAEYIKGTNYRLFLDLICKLVVDYHDCVLLKREYSPGKLSEWNRRHLYLRFNDANDANILHQGGSPSSFAPPQYRFHLRHNNHIYYFSAYKDAIRTVNFTEIYQQHIS